jgi:hypothetical protein
LNRFRGPIHISKYGLRQTDGKNLVWFGELEKKTSQSIKDYFYIPFFLLIILWEEHRVQELGECHPFEMPLHALRGQHLRIGKPQGAPKVSIARILDTVFAKTSPKSSFSMTENEYFGLVFAKTGSGSINSGTGAVAGYHSRKQAMSQSH